MRYAILSVRRRRTVAPRMRTLFNFLLGHRNPVAPCFQLPKSIRPATPKINPTHPHPHAAGRIRRHFLMQNSCPQAIRL